MTVKFRHPPINELVIGTYFQRPLNELRVEYVGMFWQRIREQYPKAQQQRPIGDVFDVAEDEFMPLPRFWFISEDDATLVQLQKTGLLFNWRKREDNYPHYEILKKTRDRVYAEFETFVKEDLRIDAPALKRCELTYVNLIDQSQYWQDYSMTGNVIPSFRPILPEATSGQPYGFHYVLTQDPEHGIKFRITLKTVHHRKNPRGQKLVLELCATGDLQNPDNAATDEWFERAHDAITKYFLDLTNEDIRNEHWRPIEVTP